MFTISHPGAVITVALLLAVGCRPSPTEPPPPGEGVYLHYSDSLGYTFMRNGEPFHVVGASGDAAPALLAEYGANTVRVYEPDSLGVALDRAAENGLAVAADIYLPAYEHHYSDPVGLLTESCEQVVTTVTRYRNHPALLYWTLGNEVFQSGYTDEYLTAYNELSTMVSRLDPHHPVTTAILAHQLLDLKAGFKQARVDFISLNVYGNIAGFDTKKMLFSPIWNGPYLLSEWGTNGYWETDLTSWNTPIEPTSTKKAEQLRERYLEYVAPIDDRRMLGSLAFFWGNKYEQTPTWFSLLGPDGGVSEMAYELGNLWRGREDAFPGPKIDYLLLDGRGAASSILLSPHEEVTAQCVFPGPVRKDARVRWAVHPEDWRYLAELGLGAQPLTGLLSDWSTEEASFTAPAVPGPYRLYYEITYSDGYFATANIPFYVVAPSYAK